MYDASVFLKNLFIILSLIFSSLLHKPLRELRAGGIVEVGEAVPVVLSCVDAGVVSYGGGLISSAVCAVVFTVIVMEFVGTYVAVMGQEISAPLFQFDVSETHQPSCVEAFSGQNSRH